MEVKIKNNISRSNDLQSLIISTEDTLFHLRKKIKINLKVPIDINRIGISFESSKGKRILMTSNERKVHQYEITQGTVITIKDLGYQIGYRTVYIIEYLGPILINTLFFWNKGHFNNHPVISLIFLMINFHYIKRILESIFVHIFSKDTMPFMNLFKNCTYYWGLFGLICCSQLYSTSYKHMSIALVTSDLFLLFFSFFQK